MKTLESCRAYFEKHGFIFGDSFKYDFGGFSHRVERFDDFSEAERWLNTEQYDFRTRELISKSEAKKRGYKGF